jgi:hypothetical protein
LIWFSNKIRSKSNNNIYETISKTLNKFNPNYIS